MAVREGAGAAVEWDGAGASAFPVEADILAVVDTQVVDIRVEEVDIPAVVEADTPAVGADIRAVAGCPRSLLPSAGKPRYPSARHS
jgi:hypothetical protein